MEIIKNLRLVQNEWFRQILALENGKGDLFSANALYTYYFINYDFNL